MACSSLPHHSFVIVPKMVAAKILRRPIITKKQIHLSDRRLWSSRNPPKWARGTNWIRKWIYWWRPNPEALHSPLPRITSDEADMILVAEAIPGFSWTKELRISAIMTIYYMLNWLRANFMCPRFLELRWAIWGVKTQETSFCQRWIGVQSTTSASLMLRSLFCSGCIVTVTWRSIHADKENYNLLS